MRLAALALIAAALGLAACGGAAEEEEAAPDTLELTPGSWASNAERASFADDEGNWLATFRCDPEAAELVLETPGAFAAGARNAMLVRVGRFSHGIESVEVREQQDGPVKLARLPALGLFADTIRAAPTPMTIETDGADPLMIEIDPVLQAYVGRCGEASGAAE